MMQQIAVEGRNPLPVRAARVESAVHRVMKEVVRAELERERYSVVEEPLFIPGEKVTWSSYRPDLMGYRRGNGSEEIVLVECETRPSMRRFRLKNHSSVWLQPSLAMNGSVRRVLAIRRGWLRAVDMELRSQWEIWVLGEAGPLVRIPRVGSDCPSRRRG